MPLRLRCLVESAPRPNRHWTDEELLSRCLTVWEGAELGRAEPWSRSVVGGLVVAGLVTIVAVLVMMI